MTFCGRNEVTGRKMLCLTTCLFRRRFHGLDSKYFGNMEIMSILHRIFEAGSSLVTNEERANTSGVCTLRNRLHGIINIDLKVLNILHVRMFSNAIFSVYGIQYYVLK